MATDWTAAKLKYVHGSMTMRDLADALGIKAAGLMKRAANEGWDSERKQESAKVSKAAGESLGDERANRLAKFNEQDAKISEALKAKAAKFLNSQDLSVTELRALSAVFDAAQKIGLLAVGAATANTTVTTKELPASVDEFV